MQLRSYIPIAGPARREAVDGTEAPVRAVLGFEPAWYHHRCGMDLGERWHRDPEYRAEALRKALRNLRQWFPAAVQWHGPEEPLVWTLGGVDGIGIIPRLFGMRLEYFPDRWPVLMPGAEDADDPAARLIEQAEQMARGGPVSGDLNWQGVLNVAFHVRGQEIFVDLAERPEQAQAFFEKITGTIIALGQRIQSIQRASGFPIDYMCVSNCTVNMISPRMYERLLRPHDERIAQAFARFGVHTCNWDVTPYLDALAGLSKVGYLDMGLASDLRKARSKFPQARLGVLYSPWKLESAPATEIEADIARVAREVAPCDIIAADITCNTPDARVNELLAICERACAAVTSGTSAGCTRAHTP